MADLSQFLDEQFDDVAVAPSTGVPEPVPPGEYTMTVESTEVIPTKDQTGVLLKATMSIASGPCEGRKVFPQFNIRNKSVQAMTIGIGELKALCIAIGVPYDVARSDTDSLLHKPFKAMIGMEKEQINPQTGQPFAHRNRVMKYIAQGAAPAAVAAAPATVTPQARPVATGATAPVARAPSAGRPWDRKTA